MALIHCDDCGLPVSDKATSCPRCGCPISYEIIEDDPYVAGIRGTGVQTIQKTSKSIKLGMLLSGIAGVSGFVGSCTLHPDHRVFQRDQEKYYQEMETASHWFLVGILGLACWVVFRLMKWWHHD